jgi:hypothetical protein
MRVVRLLISHVEELENPVFSLRFSGRSRGEQTVATVIDWAAVSRTRNIVWMRCRELAADARLAWKTSGLSTANVDPLFIAPELRRSSFPLRSGGGNESCDPSGKAR